MRSSQEPRGVLGGAGAAARSRQGEHPPHGVPRREGVPGGQPGLGAQLGQQLQFGTLAPIRLPCANHPEPPRLQ